MRHVITDAPPRYRVCLRRTIRAELPDVMLTGLLFSGSMTMAAILNLIIFH